MPQRKFYNTKSQYPVHPCWAVINVHCGHLDNNGCRIVQTKAQFDKIKNILCNIYLLLKWADFSGALQKQNPNIQKWNMNNKQICEKLCESYREGTICRLFMARTHRMFMARTKTQTLQWLNNIQIVHGYNNTQALWWFNNLQTVHHDNNITQTLQWLKTHRLFMARTTHILYNDRTTHALQTAIECTLYNDRTMHTLQWQNNTDFTMIEQHTDCSWLEQHWCYTDWK